jgi:ribosomal protein S12 methylthiotransferase accessory factor
VVRSDAGAILLAGDDARFVVNTIFPLLDGTRTETDLLATLADIAPADLTGLLQALREHDLLLDGPGQDGTLDAAAQRLSRLAAATAVILGHTPWVTRAVDSIRAAGVGTVGHGPRPSEACDIAIGIFADGDASEVRDFARTMQQAAIPSLTCIIGASEALIGPFVVPDFTACGNCARLRLYANAGWSDHVEAEGRDAEHLNATAGAIFDVHLARAVCDAICLGRDGSPLVNHVLVVERSSMRTSLHRILGVPGCGVCGGPAYALQPRGDGIADHCDRALADDAMLALSSFVDSRTGIVNRIIVERPAETGLEQPIVARAIPAAAPIETAPPRPMPAGWGKASTAAAAVVGAIGEAIERYAGSMPDPTRIVWSRPADLAGAVLHPREFALYDDDQLARAGFPFVRFDPEVAHPWIAGEWAATQDPVWVPAILAYLSLDVRPEHVFCQGSSNGMAAWSDRSEAALRAILELLERDAFMTSWRCKRPGRPIRLDETLDLELKTIVSGLAAQGAQVELVLLQSVGGYPTVVCIGFGDGVRWPGVTLGLGSDPDVRTAIRQAILELGQTGPYLRRLMTTAPHLIPERASEVAEMLDHARYYFPVERAAAFDFLHDGREAVALADLRPGATRSLAACARVLAAAGVRVALVDITSADVTPFCVMRAVSPDLQPISFGYGLDRLPVPRLAALSIPTSKDEIAPIW